MIDARYRRDDLSTDETKHLDELREVFTDPDKDPVARRGAYNEYRRTLAHDVADGFTVEEYPEERDGDGVLIGSPGRRYVGPTDCPDCTRGLYSRGAYMVCMRVRPEHLDPREPYRAGSIVGCGEA